MFKEKEYFGIWNKNKTGKQTTLHLFILTTGAINTTYTSAWTKHYKLQCFVSSHSLKQIETKLFSLWGILCTWIGCFWLSIAQLTCQYARNYGENEAILIDHEHFLFSFWTKLFLLMAPDYSLFQKPKFKFSYCWMFFFFLFFFFQH